MRKFLSLIFAVFMTVMAFGQSYGILVNGTTYFAGTHKGKNFEDFDEYLAHVQINAGDYCQLYDADNDAAWAVALNTWSVEGFTLNGDRYEATVSGCYDFYIQLKYKADQLYIGNGSDCGEGVTIGGDKWTEIKFTEVVAAADIAADASFEADEFAIQVTDPDNKMAIDANPARFGTVEAFVDYTHRLKTGGKSSSTKNFITATIPAAGQLRIAVRTGSNSDETRTLVITQDEKELYNQVVKEADKTVVDETSYYPFITVDVAKGSLLLSYPVNGLNFYSFAFKAAEEQPGDDPGDDPIVETKDLKVDPNGILEAEHKLGVWAWKNGSEGAWFAVDATTDIAKIPAEADMVIVAIFEKADELSWDNVVVKSGDMTIQECGVVYLNMNEKLFFSWCEPAGEDPGDEPGEGLKNPVLKVNVPAGTKEVFVAGDFSEWAFLPMTAVEGVENQFTLTIEGEFEAIAYKYACGNDWAYREVAEDGSEIGNRSYAELDVVAKWLAIPGGEDPGDDPGDEPKKGYALLVNGADLIDLTHGEEYEGYDQWFVEGAALKAGDVVKVHSYETEASWAIGILNPASSKHVANSEEGLVFDKDGEYTIYLKLKFELDEIYVAPLPDEGGDEPVADGFYLIGTFNDWTPSAEYAFTLNPEAAPVVEYMVTIDLQEGDKLKGLAVIMGQWIYYPEGDDIVVPAEYAGKCTIYFRPEYNPDWAAFGGHIYIAKQSGQGIDEILSEGKAVKVLREGQVLIMKGNRTYTPMGQLVK